MSDDSPERGVMQWVDLPPVWLAGFAVLAWGQARVIPAPIFGSWAVPVGWALVVLGVALGVAAVVQMLRHRTTVIPRRAPRDLVTGGIFALSRNPIYLGDALILTGVTFVFNALLGVALVPIFIAVIQKRFILPEEARIAQQFGTPYHEYTNRVRRWV